MAPSTANPIDDDRTLPPSGTTRRIGEASDAISESPTDFGEYELLNELARGGMGVVYKARHKELNRIVAIKMIIGGQYSSELDIQRFQLEARAAAQLDHPGIVPIYEIGSHEGKPFFAMKLVEGGSLADQRQRFLKQPRKIAKLLAESARAVHHAHQRGILHRDIKPGNILLDGDDQPMLTDLGLAKFSTGDSHLTQTGALLGTPSYMPPEQATSSQTLTTAADVYALGAILYELLTGRPPHRGDSAMATILQVLNEPIVPVREISNTIDRDLALICMHCLEKDADKRYASANELADDLDRWLEGAPISIKPASMITRAAQWIKHNQGIAYVVMLLIAAVLFSLPLVFSVLGIIDGISETYAGTESDPRPLLYSFTNIPAWVSVLGGVGTLVLWPSLGILVTTVTRPTSWLHAAVNGGWVAGISVLLMLLLMGWAMFSIAAQSTSNSTIRLLAAGVWPSSENENETRQGIIEQLEEKYPKLKDVPDNQKINFLSNRIFADGVAVGPSVLGGLLAIATLLGLPVVLGAVIAQQLLLRGHRWWVLVPRYFLGWMGAFITCGGVYGAIGNGVINGVRYRNLHLFQQILIVVVPPLVTFLILRRWKRTPTDNEDAEN